MHEYLSVISILQRRNIDCEIGEFMQRQRTGGEVGCKSGKSETESVL